MHGKKHYFIEDAKDPRLMDHCVRKGKSHFVLCPKFEEEEKKRK